MKAISIDLGGSHATLAVVEDKSILASREIPLDSSARLLPVLPVFKTIIFELLAEAATPVEHCIGLALGICAMTDGQRVVSTNGKFEDAPGIDFHAWCRTDFGIPFAMDNDARMALLGEWYAGAAQGAKDVVMITLGTGIGGAVMAGGKLFRTSQVQGGCLGGHIPAQFMGRKCTCGGLGCMEAEASGWSLPLIAKDWPGFRESPLAKVEVINFRALFELARAGDRVSIEIRDRCLQVWACGTVGLIHAFGPERVVLGGGVMRSRDIILPCIQEYVRKYSWTPSGEVLVVAAELGSDSALLAAVPLLTAQPLAPGESFHSA